MAKKGGLVLLLIILALVVGRFFETGTKDTKTVITADLNPKVAQKTYLIGKIPLQVEIRDTEAGRELGLSYRKTLGENEGMLFVFQEANKYAFWMKDMEFPLDMIWISGGKVAQVSAGIPAPKLGEQPVVVTPLVPVDMVLEVKAGWAENNGVKVGDPISK
jgi:uncharacterized membrane protein (UPF0127 family)